MNFRCEVLVKACLLLVLIITTGAAAREYSIITDDHQALYYDLNRSRVAVSFGPTITTAQKESLLSGFPALASPAIERVEAPLNMTILRLKPNSDETAVLATLSALESNSNIEWAAPVLMYDGLEHVPTPRLYIQFDDKTSSAQIQAALDKYGLTLIKRCDDWARNVVYVSRPKGTGVETLDIASSLAKEAGVVWASPDFNRQFYPYTTDTYYNNQWYLHQTSRHDIHAPEAWAITTGDTSVVISICDVGVQIAHPDLAGHIVTGYDAVDSDNDPTPYMTADDGHGTCCAGIAAAVTNNGVGIAGVGYNCRLMGTRMGYISGGYIQGSDSWTIACINWSRDHADIQSDSWGGGSSSGPINTALANAKAAGLTILFSSGNSNNSIQWPATQSTVICVGATNENDYRCTPSDWGGGQGSCYGSQLDVVAPGNNQYATDLTGTYGYASGSYYSSFGGTSGACPVAAGVCALILSRNHALIPDTVQAILQRTANDLVGAPGEDVAGWDQYMGWGRVNAGNAVAAVGPNIVVTAPAGGESWYIGEAHNITWTSSGVTGNIKIELNRAYPGTTWETIIASTANTGTYAWTVTAAATSAARMRITSVSAPTVGDTSTANFTIALPVITVSSPNGSENWYTGEVHDITWSSVGMTGNVKIELNRSYSGGAWETIIASTANSGTYSWTVTAPATTAARVRVSSVNQPTALDISDANFTITQSYVTVIAPNGGELWIAGTTQNLLWSSAGFTGNIKVELNRSYPGGAWEVLFSVVANDGTEPWIVTSPSTSNARIRITSLDQPTVFDISNADFRIGGQPPAFYHDPLHDFAPGSGSITARSFSLLASVSSVKMFKRVAGTGSFDSLTMNATVTPNEYAASLASLVSGDYEYYLRSVDNVGLVSYLPSNAPASLYTFNVSPLCAAETAYDDGSADWFNYPGDFPGTQEQFAVKFGPVAPPYVLCGARFCASRALPDTFHTPVNVMIYLADGVNGKPGTLIQQLTKGSVGNVIGGLPLGTNFAQVNFHDVGGPLVINASQFYVAVANIQQGLLEGFGRDTTSLNNHRSYFYDPCLTDWFSEDSVTANPNAHPGNRMIRIQGYSLASPSIVLSRQDTVIVLNWTKTGAPLFEIFACDNPGGPYSTFMGTTADTFYTVSRVDTAGGVRFYMVKSATP